MATEMQYVPQVLTVPTKLLRWRLSQLSQMGVNVLDVQHHNGVSFIEVDGDAQYTSEQLQLYSTQPRPRRRTRRRFRMPGANVFAAVLIALWGVLVGISGGLVSFVVALGIEFLAACVWVFFREPEGERELIARESTRWYKIKSGLVSFVGGSVLVFFILVFVLEIVRELTGVYLLDLVL